MAHDGEDDLGAGGGQGLDVEQLAEAAFLQRHDLAGGVGGVHLRVRVAGRRGGLPAGLVQRRAGLGQGRAGAFDLAALVDAGDRAGAADALPGGGLAGAVLQAVRGRLLPFADRGFLLPGPVGELGDPGLEPALLLLAPGVLPGRELGADGLPPLQHQLRPLRLLLLLRPAAAAAAVTAVTGTVAAAVISAVAQHVLGPSAEPGVDHRFQLGDLGVQLRRGHVGGHRRVRLQLGAVPGDQVQGYQALPGACLDRLRQQRAGRVQVRPDELRDGGMIRVQAPADDPGADVIVGGHLDLPGGPAAPAVAVQQQRGHHRRAVRAAALPVGPVPRPEPGQVHLPGQVQHPPRQVPFRQPLPRVGRHQHRLVRPVPVPEFIPHTAIIPRKDRRTSENENCLYKRLNGIGLTKSREKSPDSLYIAAELPR